MAQFLKLGPAVAGDIDSEAASAGQVLTADGSGAAVAGLYFDIHVELDTLGSREEYTK